MLQIVRRRWRVFSAAQAGGAFAGGAWRRISAGAWKGEAALDLQVLANIARGARPGIAAPNGRRATLSYDSTSFTYVMMDGAIVVFLKSLANSCTSKADSGHVSTIIRPSGFNYYAYNLCIPSGQDCTNVPAHGLLSVASSLGYQIRYPWTTPTAADRKNGKSFLLVEACASFLARCGWRAGSVLAKKSRKTGLAINVKIIALPHARDWY
ncbi:hypothetical protein [Caulobacter sp. UNC279MFTsu5.1]|uniref:hypothetical protein n=1 Tax=Caulobacter sp. UNC279MFTsu5.1 TaxID=1502775 RepID=UPI0008E6F069|nr:hypothetical protein [Caulobacter sp. UNC279MFTsu5.1]SFK15926.1 hypothetical protein SAMN02799626_03559 [Caulobacter sp. UNC279MFTsu5.1]